MYVRERIHIFLWLWLFSLAFKCWFMVFILLLHSPRVLLVVGAPWFESSVIVAVVLTEGIARIFQFVLCTAAIVLWSFAFYITHAIKGLLVKL